MVNSDCLLNAYYVSSIKWFLPLGSVGKGTLSHAVSFISLVNWHLPHITSAIGAES